MCNSNLILFTNCRSRRFFLFLLLFSQTGICSYGASYKEGAFREIEVLHDEALPLIAEATGDDPAGLPEAEHEYDLILNKIIKENRFVEELEAGSFYSLPIAILPPGVSDPSYALVIDKAEIHPDHAELSAFMVITNPFDNSKVRFRADKIRFSFSAGLTGDVSLSLMDAKSSKLINDVRLNWLPGSYIAWDCNGFKSIGINGEIELSEKRFQAVKLPSFNDSGKVKSTFFAEFSDFKNFVVDISLPAFKIKGINELAFHFQNVVLDFSDKHNAASFSFPNNYPGYYSGELANLWRGLFISHAEIFLSEKFNGKQDRPVSFYAQNLLLDDYGLTGLLGAKNILSIESGALGNWPFSIDDISIELLAGSLHSFAFAGDMILPGTSTGLAYDAYMDAESTYHFGIGLNSPVDFDVFAARATLHQSSRIDVHIEKGKFAPTAMLNGELSFSASGSNKSSDNPTLNLPSLRFEGLRISTVPPVLDINYIDLSSGNENGLLANFPVTVDDISFRKVGNESVAFGFKMRINLTPGDGGAISGEAQVAVVSDVSSDNWRFVRLDVSEIKVGAEKAGAFSFAGSIMMFEDDPVYGKGFKGSVKASFADTFELGATALFGRVDGYRYFYTDAYFYSSTGITAGPFILNGFGGGLSYRMRQQIPGSGAASPIGETRSGICYVPDNSISLGISAGVKAGIVNENIVQGEISFAIIFNKSGGINQISFTGEAALLSPGGDLTEDQVKSVSQAAAKGEAQKSNIAELMRARILILMDFEERIFHTEMEVYLNIAGAITGIGPNNRAGWGVLHIEPSKWYLHMGTPADPVGVSIVGLFKAQSYFMAGHDIPDVMMMDARVLDILGMKNADFDGDRDPNQLISGKGIAFGAKVSFDTGDMRFLIFYAAFEMGFGFDISLLQYDDNFYCEGRDGLGINNWYARGQVYAYVAGKVGIRARIFRKTRTFDILNIQAAAAMRMEGPNPFWMMGAVGGKYKILGGMIRGTCKFEMTLGSKCNMKYREDELSDIEIIGDITPGDRTDDIDPFVYPQVVFNMPVGKAMKVSEDEKTTKEFRVSLAEYSLYREETRINGVIEWNEDNTTLAFMPDEVLYPVTGYRIVVKAGFDEKVNGSWSPYKDDSGGIHYETREVNFITGNLPPEIPESEITYSYPLKRMMNLYVREYPKAYIAFNRWIPGYFNPQEGWVQKVRWAPAKGGQVLYSDLLLKPGLKSVETDIPSGLTKGATYYMELVNMPLERSAGVDKNVFEQVTQVVEGENGEVGTEIATRAAEGLIGDQEEITFYSLGFRVSKYATLAEKIGADDLAVRFLYNAGPAVDFPGVTIYPGEPFDGYEIEHNANALPLIRFSAMLEESDWYKAYMYPVLYEGYPIHRNARVKRNIQEYGLPPIRPVRIIQTGYNYIMTEEDIQQQRIESAATYSHFVYELPKIWASDYVDIRNEISVSISMGQRNDKMLYLLNHYPWPQVSAGNYPIKIDYVLPGINKVSSSHILNLKNPFDTPQVNLITDE